MFHHPGSTYNYLYSPQVPLMLLQRGFLLSHSILGLEWKQQQQQTNTSTYLPEVNIAVCLIYAVPFVCSLSFTSLNPSTCHYLQELAICKTRNQSKIESYK